MIFTGSKEQRALIEKRLSEIAFDKSGVGDIEAYTKEYSWEDLMDKFKNHFSVEDMERLRNDPNVIISEPKQVAGGNYEYEFIFGKPKTEKKL